KLVDKGGYRPLQWRYRWDAKSQLTGLETPEGERWEYKYDPFGRRISKRCTNRDKPGINFHWNGDQLAEEIPVSADGKPEYENAIRWIYEPGNFTPLARYEKGQLHYAVTGTVGRIQELLTEEGTIVWRGQQQLWGKEEGRSQKGAPSCRLRFPGQYEDEESGLFYNRYRYYDSEIGQYVSPDPIGLLGGLNPYGYASNPLKYIDPQGLCKTDIDNSAHNAADYQKLKDYYTQYEKYGSGGVRGLDSGRYRFYDETKPPRTPGEMAGARLTREWDPSTGNKRTWYETIDHSGNVRSVAPKPVTHEKNHHIFDSNGDYQGRR
ncbi:RHS repeat-associated core domain-containing protein, partial [Hafnia alvei]